MTSMPTSSTPSSQPRLESIANHFDGCQRNGQGYVALCPVHNDSTPSLSINQGKDGKILIHCHAGCRTANILAAVGLSMKNLMPSNGNPQDQDDQGLFPSVQNLRPILPCFLIPHELWKSEVGEFVEDFAS